MPPRFERQEVHRTPRTYDEIVNEVKSIHGVPEEKIHAVLEALKLFLETDTKEATQNPSPRARLKEALAQIGITLDQREPRKR
jgi:hypothetical protein